METNGQFHATVVCLLKRLPCISLQGGARTSESVSTLDSREKSRVPAVNVITNRSLCA